MLEQGITYIGPNPYRTNSPLAGLPSTMNGDRVASFSSDRRAQIAPAAVHRAAPVMPTPDLVGGREHRDVSYEWPVFRETLPTRSMNGGFTPADGAGMMQRTAKGVEKMLAIAFQTGAITFSDGEVIDVWQGQTPEFTPTNAWDAASGDPLSDILEAADSMVAHGARPARRLLLASDSYRALMKSAEVRDLLDNRRIDVGGLKPERAPGVLPVAMPSNWGDQIPINGRDMLSNYTYEPELGSFAYVGELHGVEIFRDAAGLIQSGGGIMLSRAGLMGGGLDADYYLAIGYPWIGGEQIRQQGAEFGLYKSVQPDGATLDSYSFIALCWSNVWGALHLDGLTTP